MAMGQPRQLIWFEVRAARLDCRKIQVLPCSWREERHVVCLRMCGVKVSRDEALALQAGSAS